MPNINNITTPAQLYLTGNPIVLQIAGNHAFTGSLSKFSAGLNVVGPGTFTVNGRLTFSYNGKTIVFTAMDDPADFALQMDLIATNTELYTYLVKSSDLCRDYIITVDSEGIHFTAREPGSEYNLTMASDWDGITFLMPSNASDHALSAGYKIGLNIEKDTEVIQMEFPVSPPEGTDILPSGFNHNTAGVIKIDISEILAEFITGNFSFPVPPGYSRIQNLIKLAKIYAYEKPNCIGNYLQSIRYLQGGLGNFKHGELNYLAKSVYDMIVDNGMFLTLAPLEKSIDIYSPEKLYFLFAAAGTFYLLSKEYYSDGTTAEVQREVIQAADWEIRELFVSYSKIYSSPMKQLVKYEIYLHDQAGSNISEKRTFTIDYRYQNFARYFIFKNQFGVYECLRTTGKATKTLDIVKDFVNNPLPYDFTDLSWGNKQISETDTATYKVNTGYIQDKYWADWVKTFLTSAETYWLKKGIAYPVNILAGKNQVSQDGDYNPFQEFELTHSIQDDITEEFDAHSPILSGDFDEDFNLDFDNGDNNTVYNNLLTSDFSSWTDGVPDGFYFNNHGGTANIQNVDNQCKVTDNKSDSIGCQLNTTAGLLAFGKQYRVEFDVIDCSVITGTNICSMDCSVWLAGAKDNITISRLSAKTDVVKHWVVEDTVNISGDHGLMFGFASAWSGLDTDPWIIIDNVQVFEVTPTP